MFSKVYTFIPFSRFFNSGRFKQFLSRGEFFLPNRKGRVLWVHTPSVGEFNTVKPLLEKLKDENTSLVLTYFSPRASDYLKRQTLPDAVFRLPLPLSPFINRFVEGIKPDVLIIVEGDRFPALYSAPVAKKFVVNARMSERSFNFLKRLKFLFKKPLRSIDLYLCKTFEDCLRFKRLGVPEQKLKVCGNLKAVPPKGIEQIEPKILFPADSFVFTAGSTHPGEEEFLLPALDLLFKRIPGFKAVIAPRHIERAQRVMELLKNAFPEKRIYLRSEVKDGKTFEGDILVVDTLGELLSFYKASNATFVGGTVNPKVGGHNLLEPAYFGKPVLFGKYIHKVKDLAEILNSLGLGFQVVSPVDLAEKVIKLHKFETPKENPLRELGEKILNCYLESLKISK